MEPRRHRSQPPPRIAAVGTALPPHRYRQRDLIDLASAVLPELGVEPAVLARFFTAVGVRERYLALSAAAYGELTGLEARNDAWLEVAQRLGERAVRAVLDQSGLDPAEVGQLITSTVTGIAVPSLDARLMNRIAFSPALERVPLFGLGCVAGAAGLARAADYLRAFPRSTALVLSVELCSLTLQPRDASVANIIASGLFGDGAAAVLLAGAEHPLAGRAAPAVVDSCSAFFPGTERMMGWDVVDTGFRVVLSPEVPGLVGRELRRVIDPFVAAHDLSCADIGAWVAHPGGPKVLRAMEQCLGLDDHQLAASRQCLAEVGNLSSASVLFVLDRVRGEVAPGTHGLLLALGPGFCAEVVLLRW